MLKISDASRLTGVPVKTLRYWEEFGLFRPAFVDEWTGYRQYSEGNIERISQIVYLKELGFSLKEIKELSDEVIKAKEKELEALWRSVKLNLGKISSLRKDKKGEYIMKNFVNDEKAIGHWALLGLAEKEEDALEGKLYQEKDFIINDLYLMEKGKEYWVIGWTKGAIFINGRKNPYKIDGDNMIVAISYDGEEAFYAVYKKVDSLKHDPNEIKIVDNVNLPFVFDDKTAGVWKYFDIIRDAQKFNPKKKFWKGTCIIEQLSLVNNGDALVEFTNGKILKWKWTDGAILCTQKEQEACMHYQIVTKGKETYLIMEWKSGDYLFGGKIKCHYVFKKEG